MGGVGGVGRIKVSWDNTAFLSLVSVKTAKGLGVGSLKTVRMLLYERTLLRQCSN